MFENQPDYVPTALIALSLKDAERLCSRLNAPLAFDRDACMKLVAQAMHDAGPTDYYNLH